jgi:hypothetical protein
MVSMSWLFYGYHVLEGCNGNWTLGETFFMYLRAIFCTFQISVDFYFVLVGGRGGAGEGEGAREMGIECILYGYT